jgi:hypothetical protein
VQRAKGLQRDDAGGELHEAQLHPVRRAQTFDAGGEARGDTKARLDLTQRQLAAIE